VAFAGNDSEGWGCALCLPPQRLPRPNHHLDAADQIARVAQNGIHLLAPLDALRGIVSMFQPVGVA
jgi:hypothetical protein